MMILEIQKHWCIINGKIINLANMTTARWNGPHHMYKGLVIGLNVADGVTEGVEILEVCGDTPASRMAWERLQIMVSPLLNFDQLAERLEANDEPRSIPEE